MGNLLAIAVAVLLSWQDHPFVPSENPKVRRATLPLFSECIRGPGVPAACGCRARFDMDDDGDVDLFDLAEAEVGRDYRQAGGMVAGYEHQTEGGNER